MAYLIGIDLGTSGTKTVLFDQEGHVVASATVEYPMYQEHNGWAEQDPWTGGTPPARPSRPLSKRAASPTRRLRRWASPARCTAW